MMTDTKDTVALPRPSKIGGQEWGRLLAQRRKDSRELTALIQRLDGGAIMLPTATGPRCDRPCLAVDRETLHLWFEKYGGCPCETARRATS